MNLDNAFARTENTAVESGHSGITNSILVTDELNLRIY